MHNYVARRVLNRRLPFCTSHKRNMAAVGGAMSLQDKQKGSAGVAFPLCMCEFMCTIRFLTLVALCSYVYA